MNLVNRPESQRFERRSGWIAAAAGVAALGLIWLDPDDFAFAYRFVVFACLGPAVGCLIFTLIHRLTGGQWATGLRPFLLAGVSLLPWIWLFALPIPFLPLGLSRPAPRLAYTADGYESLSMMAVRSLVYAAIFFGLSRAVLHDVERDDVQGHKQRPWVGPVGLLVLVFTMTLLADDWISSLDPGWHSTGFSFVWMTGQAVAGLSLALLGGLSAGAQPVTTGEAGRPLGIDWGNLLMATLLCWCYVAFAQFLIIWAGNLPAEISWFKLRTNGLLSGVPAILAVFSFLLPFLLLLSRSYKMKAGGLAVVAVMLLLSQGLYTAWLILPAAGRFSPAGWCLVLALLVSGAGAGLSRYAATARILRRPAG
jgi:hypothetical protein